MSARDRSATDPTEVPVVAEVVAAVKPRLRGWLHAGAAPLALAAGIVLVAWRRPPSGVVGGAVFLAASVLLFGTSGLYHRGAPWGTRARRCCVGLITPTSMSSSRRPTPRSRLIMLDRRLPGHCC